MSAMKEKLMEDMEKVSKITGLKGGTVLSAMADMKVIRIPDYDAPDYITELSKEIVKCVYRYLVTELCEKVNYKYSESFIWERINERIDDISSGKYELPECETVFDSIREITLGRDW